MDLITQAQMPINFIEPSFKLADSWKDWHHRFMPLGSKTNMAYSFARLSLKSGCATLINTIPLLGAVLPRRSPSLFDHYSHNPSVAGIVGIQGLNTFLQEFDEKTVRIHEKGNPRRHSAIPL